MSWNWQHEDWPKFQFEPSRMDSVESVFLLNGGILAGAFKHLKPPDEQELIVEAALSEAMTTSAIEGEFLDRQSVRSSLLRHFGLSVDQKRSGPREEGIARLTFDVFRSSGETLTEDTLLAWHDMLMQERSDLHSIGNYRIHDDPMRIVSGAIGHEKVHFEAPPSDRVPDEMNRFLAWFGESRASVRTVTRAGLAHLYFESIHPFEDGNGRIGRAISEVALSQGLGQASLTLLSTEIESRKKQYYQQLELASRGLEVSEWLVWFGEVVLAAQRRTQAWLEFIIAKARLLDEVNGKINERQERGLMRMFEEGPAGFKGGLSSGNYQTITGASPATAGRDLAELVDLGALRRTGEGKGTRYWLPF